MTEITKVQLIEQLHLWNSQKIDNEQLQEWMVTHYDPPEVEIGLGETEWVVDAMNIIMNEYELAKLNKFKRESYQFALAFLDSDENNFEQYKYYFVHDGFLD
ncbi:hypothetical protein [Psychromonas hadalis]|uniref:hypothetical protein n=1 Tax=Psychromonas hadalis TaxID=211669 RepID=UPI0003B730A9|nr:hypothetical protein [Psychromonas hadalis]